MQESNAETQPARCMRHEKQNKNIPRLIYLMASGSHACTGKCPKRVAIFGKAGIFKTRSMPSKISRQAPGQALSLSRAQTCVKSKPNKNRYLERIWFSHMLHGSVGLPEKDRSTKTLAVTLQVKWNLTGLVDLSFAPVGWLV